MKIETLIIYGLPVLLFFAFLFYTFYFQPRARKAHEEEVRVSKEAEDINQPDVFVTLKNYLQSLKDGDYFDFTPAPILYSKVNHQMFRDFICSLLEVRSDIYSVSSQAPKVWSGKVSPESKHIPTLSHLKKVQSRFDEAEEDESAPFLVKEGIVVIPHEDSEEKVVSTLKISFVNIPENCYRELIDFAELAGFDVDLMNMFSTNGHLPGGVVYNFNFTFGITVPQDGASDAVLLFPLTDVPESAIEHFNKITAKPEHQVKLIRTKDRNGYNFVLLVLNSEETMIIIDEKAFLNVIDSFEDVQELTILDFFMVQTNDSLPAAATLRGKPFTWYNLGNGSSIVVPGTSNNKE